MDKIIKKNINQEQRAFLKVLDDREIEIFNFSDIETRLGILNKNLSSILANLVHHKLLVQLEKGKY